MTSEQVVVAGAVCTVVSFMLGYMFGFKHGADAATKLGMAALKELKDYMVKELNGLRTFIQELR